MRKYICVLSLFILSGCNTLQTVPTESPETVSVPGDAGGTIDVEGLQRALGLNRSAEDLGYKEKTFDTCSVGYGYSSTHDCRKETLAVIHFRLQCRHSEGTISTALSASDIRPVTNRVRFNLGSTQGFTQTDGEGYGQIRVLAPKSPKNDRLRLTVKDQFLTMRASEMSRMVAPRPWCE